VTLERLHRHERRRPVSGQAEVVSVNVKRVGEFWVVDCMRHRLGNLPGRDLGGVDVRVDVDDA